MAKGVRSFPALRMNSGGSQPCARHAVEDRSAFERTMWREDTEEDFTMCAARTPFLQILHERLARFGFQFLRGVFEEPPVSSRYPQDAGARSPQPAGRTSPTATRWHSRADQSGIGPPELFRSPSASRPPEVLTGCLHARKYADRSQCH